MAAFNGNMATVTPTLRNSLATPESRPRGAVAAVTPTLMLSEGPLTPSTPKSGQSRLQQEEFESMKLQLSHLSKLVESTLCKGSSSSEQAEYELGQLREALAHSEARFQEQSGQFVQMQLEYQREIDLARAELKKVEEKLVAEEIQRRKAQNESKKMANLQSYLQKLPSIEEYESLKDDLEELKVTHSTLNDQLKTTKMDLEEKSAKLVQAEKELVAVKLKNEDLEAKLAIELSTQAAKLHRKNEALSMNQQDFEAALEKNDKLTEENTKLRKYVVLTKKQHQKEISSMTKDLEQATLSVTELSRQVDNLTDVEKSLTASNSFLRGQVEKAYGELADLRQKVAIFSKIQTNCESLQKQRRQVLKDTSETVDEFMSLSNAWLQMINGQDPDLSCLLGIDPCSPESMKLDRPRDDIIAEEDFIRDISDHVGQLRLKVQELRNVLSDKYAENLASSAAVNCVYQ